MNQSCFFTSRSSTRNNFILIVGSASTKFPMEDKSHSIHANLHVQVLYIYTLVCIAVPLVELVHQISTCHYRNNCIVENNVYLPNIILHHCTDWLCCGNGGQSMVQQPRTETLPTASMVLTNQRWWKQYVKPWEHPMVQSMDNSKVGSCVFVLGLFPVFQCVTFFL